MAAADPDDAAQWQPLVLQLVEALQVDEVPCVYPGHAIQVGDLAQRGLQWQVPVDYAVEHGRTGQLVQSRCIVVGGLRVDLWVGSAVIEARLRGKP